MLLCLLHPCLRYLKPLRLIPRSLTTHKLILLSLMIRALIFQCPMRRRMKIYISGWSPHLHLERGPQYLPLQRPQVQHLLQNLRSRQTCERCAAPILPPTSDANFLIQLTAPSIPVNRAQGRPLLQTGSPLASSARSRDPVRSYLPLISSPLANRRSVRLSSPTAPAVSAPKPNQLRSPSAPVVSAPTAISPILSGPPSQHSGSVLDQEEVCSCELVKARVC